MYDVAIIGAGITGMSIARELSKYDLKVCVLEKEVDIAMGTTKANSAIVHAGFDAKPGTLKAKLNAKANSMFDQLSKDLDFHFRRNGSLVLCFDEKDMDHLRDLMEQGIQNGVPDLVILDKAAVLAMEPNLSEDVVAALYAPTGGIVCPYEMAIGMAENAYENGVEFFFENTVLDIQKLNNGYALITDKNTFKSKLVVNAAGVYSDKMNNFVSSSKLSIIPRRGEYCVFDKEVGSYVDKTIFQLPTKLGKGVLVTPTVDGNLLIGPNAVDIDDKDDLTTTRIGLDEILRKASLSIKKMPSHAIIASFTGLRARTEADDFIIGEVPDAKGFINAAGIESPGLTCAPFIGAMVKEFIVEMLHPLEKSNFNPLRKGIHHFLEMTNEERKALIKQDPAYGKIVCRCETVSEGEILSAIHRPLGATTLDGIKRRTRAGSGRCQAGFCMTRVLDILSRELEIKRTEVTKFGGESKLLVGKNKQDV
ncbi:MAG: FAD/NAD(P)-binding oxidoreductase [Clostridia bacterium]|jgi:glycerol-3-phosphate dehydrogenase|nr:FAD/NAD(P)-binding oxidoreductase [Clostridia bacterium]